jgi:hypothetical protein
MFSESDLIAAVERHLLQAAETCRGLLVARAQAAAPARRQPLRERIESSRIATALHPAATAPGEAGGKSLAAQAARWRQARREQARGTMRLPPPGAAPPPDSAPLTVAAPSPGLRLSAPSPGPRRSASPLAGPSHPRAAIEAGAGLDAHRPREAAAANPRIEATGTADAVGTGGAAQTAAAAGAPRTAGAARAAGTAGARHAARAAGAGDAASAARTAGAGDAASAARAAGAGDAASAAGPLALFLSPGKAVFLTVKRRRLAARAEEAVVLSPSERLHHRRLRDCGFAVHVIAAETPADARDQVTALLRRLGLPING